MLPALVDALNLLHAVPAWHALLEAGDLPRASTELVVLLGRWGRLRGEAPTVVFDGDAPRARPRSKGVNVLFSGGEADDVIVNKLDEQPGRWRLVSADAELVKYARARGCDVVAPRAFFDEVRDELAAQDEERRRTEVPSAREVAMWLSVFGGEPAPKGRPEKPLPPMSTPASTPAEKRREQQQMSYWTKLFSSKLPPDPWRDL